MDAVCTRELEMKERTLEGFGRRLASLRTSRGLTQAALSEKIGVSRRVIAYYEHENAQPPGPMLIDLAAALRVSVDQLLGRKPVKEQADPKSARLLNRLRRIESLPQRERKGLLLVIDGLLAKHGNTGENNNKKRKGG